MCKGWQARVSSAIRRSGSGLLIVCLIANVCRANAELLRERVEKAAQDRINAGAYQTLVFLRARGPNFGIWVEQKEAKLTKFRTRTG